MILRALVALALLQGTPALAGQAAPDPTAALLLRLETAAAGGDRAAIFRLARDPDVPGLDLFASIATPTPTRLIIKERDRTTLESGADRLLLEVFAEYESEAAITTWRAETTAAADGERHLTAIERLTVVTGLHRLALDPNRQFEVRNLTMSAIDLRLELPSGSAFVAEIPDGPTALVLIGRGRLHFTPSDPAEQTQVRIFSGKPTLSTEFDAVFVRFRPSEFDRLFGTALVPVPTAARMSRRATDVFEDYVGQTYHVDLADLSRDRWSLVPAHGDLVVEARTRRLGSLTYTRSGKDPEDISLFDRRRRRNISVYASPEKLAARGPFYSENDLAEYEVEHYEIDAWFAPDRLWVEGTTRMRLRVRTFALASLSIRLADSLVVRSVVSPEFGRLLNLRVVGQNSVIVNFPTSLPRDSEIVLDVTYGGRLEPQQIDREGVIVGAQQPPAIQELYIPIEPSWLYSNRSYWYPQSMVTDYATADIRISVPPEYDVVATGRAWDTGREVPGAPGERPRKQFTFEADLPTRYFALAISRFAAVGSREVSLPLRAERLTRSGGSGDSTEQGPRLRSGQGPSAAGAAVDDPAGQSQEIALTLSVLSTPRQVSRARPMGERAADILAFYGRLVGDLPYPSFTLAVAENELPGGHSPAYFALLNEPSPLSPLVWRNDPVAFESYPPFFLAHEIAHQWWGQAVGWKNYHEQWLSEGFSQYFAVMYAANDRGADLQASMLRQMRRWAIEQSSQGPVYLGYRLGHIRSDGRVFRALVYNKGAMVLHMLRRLVGEEAFVAGIRRYYGEWKFRKAGTDDLRAAMEAASGVALTPFFDGWIYGSAIPALRFTSQVSGTEALLRFEHRGQVLPTPVTVSILYADGRSEEMVVAVTERVVERRVALAGAVRSIDANRDHGALAEFVR